MAKEGIKDLIINAPREGISSSAHLGFADIRNLDISSIPGVAQLNNILVKKSSTTVVGQVNWLVRHPITPAEIYALDDGGKVYRSGDSGATWALMTDFTSGGHGNGLWIWKNYLFVARDAFLDVCGDGAASGNGTTTGIANANWSNSWQAIDSDVLWHPMITSRNDNKLYGGAGQYVFSLDENSGQTFAPGTGATYTFTAQALDLPPSYRIKCIEELGNNLMLGTWQGTAMTDIRIANIFPWDRSATSFGQPIIVDDFGIHAMKNIGNSLIVLAGINGTVFKCDGVNAYIIGQIPTDLSGGKYLEWYPNSICSYKNKVFFGTGNGGSTAIANQGVYSLTQTGKGNILNLEHLVSTLSDGTSNPLKVSALLPVTRDTLLVGWRDNTTYGIDLTTADSYAYTTDYSGSFTTPLYVVGSYNNTRAFSELEFVLAKELATGEGIQIEYRVNLTDSFTTLKTREGGTLTLTFATLDAVTTHWIAADIPKTDMLQLRISLLGTSTTTPIFKYLILR